MNPLAHTPNCAYHCRGDHVVCEPEALELHLRATDIQGRQDLEGSMMLGIDIGN
jgi:hypothetical protein